MLLKNSGGTLPLSATGGGTVAVIGPAASAGADRHRRRQRVRDLPLQRHPAAGHPGRGRAGHHGQYTQGLPTDTSLYADPESRDLTPAYTGHRLRRDLHRHADRPGDRHLRAGVPEPRLATRPRNLSLDGKEILANPGTPPVSTYSVGVNLQAGQTYTLQLSGGGPSANLSWATPSDLAPGIAQAVAAAKAASTAVVVVSDDTESEAADRASLNLPSAQNELISAVAAANPHTVVVIDAGAPVAMPWLSQVASVVDAWYPGESNGTALAAVLFGHGRPERPPAGHLPAPSLSQVPASSPSQFPGVNGQVQYSEGIDVGYRYYDANNETPLFPFGYGLSYTNFRFSDLSDHPAEPSRTPARIPAPRAAGATGSRASQVTVSATVTNTGQVAGSDVAQLYLGDPAAAGEPPRQLKGFQKVTLQPGQSTTVRFSLTGHDLSYWDDAANGWVVPDGEFRVYVGDSSALANLPLHGGFTVVRSVGARYATVSAPDVVHAGQHRHGHRHPGQRRRLRDAAGAVHPGRPGRLDGDQSRPRSPSSRARPSPRSFQVTVPASAAARDRTLTVTVTPPADRPGGRTGQVEASTTVAVPYASLAAAYNNTGISDNSDEAAANYDGVGDSFSAQALAAGTPTALTPGQQVTIGGTTFTWPDVAPGTAGQRGRRRPDRRAVRVRDRPRLPRRQPERHRERDRHRPLHRRQQPVLQPQHGRLVRQQPGGRQPAPDHDLELELPEQPARPAPGERLLRARCRCEQGKTVASVTLPVLSSAGGHHRDAHLRHGHREPAPRRWARRTRRSPPPTTTSGSATTRTRPRPTSTAPATASRRRRWPRARRRRSPPAARPPSAGRRSPGPPPSARPTT